MVILLCLVLLLSVGGCGIKEKVTEGISEKVTEGILEQVTGGDVDFDLDGEEITIKGEDGEFTFGSTEWPEGKAADLIPRFEKGTITSVITSEGGCWISIEEVNEDDFIQYVDAVKAAGFTENPTEFLDADDSIYCAELAGKGIVTVAHSRTDKLLQINVDLIVE